MAITKSDLFTEKQQLTAELFKAVSHPARLAILELLSRKQQCICGDITEELPLAQSTVSQHLKALKKAGLIKGEIEGASVCYCLNPEGIEALEKLSGDFIHTLTSNSKDSCC